jgi:predicted acetyltransferase
MMTYRLEKPSIEQAVAYKAYLDEWNVRQEPIVPHSAQWDGESFEAFLAHQSHREDPYIVPPGFVAASFYLFMQDDYIVGAVSIRHTLNDRLLQMGGHIGYGIRPSMRGKKLAPIMLRLALIEAKRIGISRALVTCDEANQASAATIEACGGVLENIVTFDGERVKRYWIQND